MSKIRVIIAEYSIRERSFAEIYYDNKFVFELTQENGLENLMVEFPLTDTATTSVAMEIPLNSLIEAIELAKKKLASAR